MNGSLEKLKDITPETEEVKAIKDKYVKVMETLFARYVEARLDKYLKILQD